MEIGSFCKSGQTRGEKYPNSHTLPTFVRETPTSSPSAQPTDAIFTKMDIHLKKLRISSWVTKLTIYTLKGPSSVQVEAKNILLQKPKTRWLGSEGEGGEEDFFALLFRRGEKETAQRWQKRMALITARSNQNTGGKRKSGVGHMGRHRFGRHLSGGWGNESFAYQQREGGKKGDAE